MSQPIPRKYVSPLNVIYFVLGLFLLIVLLRQIDFQNLLRLLAGIQPVYLVLGGAIYLLKSAVRAMRFWQINARVRPSFLKMLRLTLASSLASQLMPLKIGEFAYIYLVKSEFDFPLSQGLSSLMVVRIYDMLAISVLFLAACLGFGLPDSFSGYFYPILGFVGLLLVLLVSIVYAGRPILYFLRAVIQRTFLRTIHIVDRLLQGGERVFGELSRFRAKDTAWLTAYPLAEWGINFAMYHVFLIGLGFDPHFLDTVTGVAFAALMSVLPVNSFGNFGTQEAGWATGLILAGYPREAALTSGFATHLLSLGFMVLMGGSAWISYLVGRTFRQQGSSSQEGDGKPTV